MDAGLKDEDAVSLSQRKAELPLYATRIKVYPRAVAGLWRRIKWAALVVLLGLYYLVPWLRWDRGPGAPDQAILIDLDGPARLVLRRRDLAAGSLLRHRLADPGRVRPVPRDLAVRPRLVRLHLPADRVDRPLHAGRAADRGRPQRAHAARPGAAVAVAKALRKTAKHAAWLAIAAATGGAWVFYYVDAPTTLVKIFRGEASTEVYFFVGLFTATTYLLAGWAREQVCTYMCPWPRFQAAMLDEQSVIVTYQKWRGEPRGKHKAGESWEGRGDCIDCRLCVAVCPTGIDIRDGQQIECIGCGLCIDACNETMAKVDRPRDLIRWDTLADQQAKEKGGAGAAAPWRPVRPRTILYALLLAVVAAVMVGAFFLRTDTDLTVQRDRSPNFVRLSNGDIRNAYTVKIQNKRQTEQRFELALDGLPWHAWASSAPRSTAAERRRSWSCIPMPSARSASS